MKNLTILFSVIALSLLVGCSGGDSGLDSALNPYGFVVNAFNQTSVPSLASNDIRAVIRPKTTGMAYIATDLGVQSFDPSLTTPTFANFAPAGPDPVPAGVNKLVVDGTAGNFYICSDTGLYKFDAVANSLTLDANIGAKRVLTFTRQSDNVFWVGLDDQTATPKPVVRVDTTTTTYTFFGSGEQMTASSVADIYADTDMVIVCGTGSTGKGGLFKFDPSGNAFVKQVVTAGLEKGASLFFKVGSSWFAGGPDSGLLTSTDNGNTWSKTNLQNCTPVDFQIEYYNYIGYQRYWIATDKATYLTYDLANFVEYKSGGGMAGDASRQIYAGGSVWVANNGGLSRLAFDGN